jgi:pimeloyl-ACP methyl ester carboxylesterase
VPNEPTDRWHRWHRWHRWYRWLRWTGVALALALGALGAVLGWLKLHEADLVFATASSHRHLVTALPTGSERISIRLADGEGIAALLLRPDPDADRGYWVLHLHGNAVSAFSGEQERHVEALRAQGFGVLAIDYRGFGLSPGTASERSIDEDAEAAWAELQRRGVAPGRVIIWGHSLGSGPAVQLASRHAAAALVLFGAFTSIPDAAADTYPYLPVRALVSVRFDSLARIGTIRMPIVIAHSLGDRVIPYHHATALYAAAQQPKRLLTLLPPYHDGQGGHVDALYEHLDLLVGALSPWLACCR